MKLSLVILQFLLAFATINIISLGLSLYNQPDLFPLQDLQESKSKSLTRQLLVNEGAQTQSFQEENHHEESRSEGHDSEEESLVIAELTQTIEAQEREIERLRKELSRTKNSVYAAQNQTLLIQEKAVRVQESLQTVYQRYVGQNQTINYIADVLTKVNPLRKLGVYETMPEQYYNFKPDASLVAGSQYYAIKHNPGYCDAVDMYNFRNPQNIFGMMNFISDYGSDESLIRNKIMRKIGHDVMRDVWLGEEEHTAFKFDLAINGTMLFFKRAMLHGVYEINKEWACISQAYNHIPGSGVIVRKDLLVNTINDYMKNLSSHPQCLPDNKFFPQSYRLDDEAECKEFFSIIKSSGYQNNKKNDPIQYLIKDGFGAHRASGVYLFDAEYEVRLKEQYNNGKACGTTNTSLVAQKYISNPLLLDKQNKFDFRIYMLIASVNPLIVYYHDGFLRVSLSKYDKNSKEKNVHFTNTHLSKEVFREANKHGNFDGMSEEQLRDYQMWTMEDLQDYLLKTGKIHDRNWLDNYLRPLFKEAFVHIARMAEDSLYKSSSVFELYGLDFVMDENLGISLIECNASPQFVGTNDKKTAFLTRMLTDMFQIQYSYLRSRVKRIHVFLRNMEIRAYKGERMNYTELRKQFDNLNMNYLEPEYPVANNSTFVKILDKNLEGRLAYMGSISEACLV